jgi:carboxyl-terminal processing protease
MGNTKSHFLTLALFITVVVLFLTNGFAGRISAQGTDVYDEVEPIAEVLTEILSNYYKEPDMQVVVEGALIGMLRNLDPHSSFITSAQLTQVKEDTEGEFEGIGIRIEHDKDGNLSVFQPIASSPAAREGVHAGDLIVKIDGVSTAGMSLEGAAELIRGPRGTLVTLTLYRRYPDSDRQAELKELRIKRDKIPLESILEARLFPGQIGYIRISDFKKNTAAEIAGEIKDLNKQGMKGLILDLRWNPGGLLRSAKQVSELFLRERTLVTYTRGREVSAGNYNENMTLYTESRPLLPEEFPLVILTSDSTASSSEIVTGALQYWKRAIIVGETTFGKGSVQTIIPLRRPDNSAIRLTTALYYTPAEVTIDKVGIKPDIELNLTLEEEIALRRQMFASYHDEGGDRDTQNHGTVSGGVADEGEILVEDVQLAKALEILQESTVFADLIEKYHRDTDETQVAAAHDRDNGTAAESDEVTASVGAE